MDILEGLIGTHLNTDDALEITVGAVFSTV